MRNLSTEPSENLQETPRMVWFHLQVRGQNERFLACAEEIRENARLCKHCGTRQDDESFALAEAGERDPILDSSKAVESKESRDWVHDYGIYRFVEADDDEETTQEAVNLGSKRVWTLIDSLDDSGVFANSDLLAEGDCRDGLTLGCLLANTRSKNRGLTVQVVERENCEKCEGDGCKTCRGEGWREVPLFAGGIRVYRGFRLIIRLKLTGQRASVN